MWFSLKKGKNVLIEMTDGKQVPFLMPSPSNQDSFFIFSIHKSGSTLLNNILVDICKKSKINYIDIEGTLFRYGYMPAHIIGDISLLFNKKGFCYLGFRSFWIENIFDISENKSILLIRDPRDALVSHYFSYLYSHAIPTRGPISNNMSINRKNMIKKNIDEYVLQPHLINSFKNVFINYEKLILHKCSKIYRYEDVIYCKYEWIKDMLNFLNIDFNSNELKKISKKHDIFPIKEEPKNHIRQVNPGNFRKHLNRNTIEKLNSVFDKILWLYAYDRAQSITK